jgi:hypothetical protein
MTSAAVDQQQAHKSPWFVCWFDSMHYHKLYGYRDESEAAGFIDELMRAIRPACGSKANSPL